MHFPPFFFFFFFFFFFLGFFFLKDSSTLRNLGLNINQRKAVETIATRLRTEPMYVADSSITPRLSCVSSKKIKCTCSYRYVTFTLRLEPKVLLKRHR